jgi:hypothetical protein
MKVYFQTLANCLNGRRTKLHPFGTKTELNPPIVTVNCEFPVVLNGLALYIVHCTLYIVH